MLKPGQLVPDLEVRLAGSDATWRLADQSNNSFTLIEMYRGYHCPRCKVHLLDLDHKVARFTERGVGVLAVSMDPFDRAEKTKSEWGVGTLDLGYGMTEAKAREWGLYISEAFQTKETERFSEPGMFLIRPDQTLYSAVYHTTPFHRHHFADVLEAVDMIRARDYPPRGTV